VPACQTGHPAPEPATTQSRALTRHPAHSGTEIKLAGAVTCQEAMSAYLDCLMAADTSARHQEDHEVQSAD
jgi:hypothetical protein